jgi:hypothetical protein
MNENYVAGRTGPIRLDRLEMIERLNCLPTKENADYEKPVRDLEREIALGLSVKDWINIEVSLNGIDITGCLKFQFRVGRDFNPDVLRNELSILIEKCEALSSIGDNPPFRDLMNIKREMSKARIVAPDGQVWGDGN